MADDSDTKPNNVEFFEALYGEPLKPDTSKAGRLLVVVSLVALLVVLFDAQFTATSVFPISFSNRSNALPASLCAIVFLLTISFALKAWVDLCREREAELLVTKYLESERVRSAQRAARKLDEQEPNPHEGESWQDPWWESYSDIKDAAEKAVSNLEEELGHRVGPRRLRRAKLILEVAIPFVMGLSAIILSALRLAGVSVILEVPS